MNIVNFSIDNELLGARHLGTLSHKHLRSTLQTASNTNTSTDINGSICDLKYLCNQNHFTSKLPVILKEHEFDLTKTNLNKIFTAQWLDDRKVIMGTKCNKIILLDTLTGKHSIQAPLKSHKNSRNIQNHCGIHSISINPSNTLLATGAEHVNDIGIYSLPNMEPVSVGYNAHAYWIFDIVWLDDQHVVSGAGDNRLALWSIDSNSSNNHVQTKSSNINTSTASNASSGSLYSSSMLSNSLNAGGSSFSPSFHHRPSLNRSWSGQNLRGFSKLNRLDRRNLKRPSPSASIMSPNRFRSPIVVRSPYFHNFYNSTTGRVTRASTAAAATSASTATSSTQTTHGHTSFSTSSINPNSNFFRQRFNFRYEMSSQGGNIYNINNYRGASRIVTNSRGSSSTNSLGSGVILRSPITNRIVFNEELSIADNNNNNNDNDNDDDEDIQTYDHNYIDDQTSDSFNSNVYYEIDDNNELDESFEMSVDENDENSFTQSSINNDDDDDDDDNNNPDDNNQENNSDEDDDDDDDNLNEDHFQFIKRRRLNSLGGFQNSNGIKYTTPTKVIKCKQSKRIRALAYNPKRNEIAAISMNAAFHYFDVNRFEQKYTKKLSPLKENVCLTINNDYSIYAIGSASHVQLLDANNARPLTNPIFIKKDIGVRSLHFRNSVLSIGTGIGTVLFYDLRANKFLNKNNSTDNHLKLQTTGGWILRNETYYDTLPYAFNTDNSHAIYSHSYDPTGTKLLTVGGPLTVNLYGHYVGVWR